MLKNWLWSYVVIVLLRLLPESALVSHIGPFGGVFITLAIFLLYPKVSALLKDYMCQKSKGLDPTFKASGDSIDDTPAWKE